MIDSPTFCAAPWATLTVNPNDTVGLCCMNRSVSAPTSQIQSFYASDTITAIKQNMLSGRPSAACEVCYFKESSGQKTSNRQLYNQQLSQHLDRSRLPDMPYENRLHYDLSLSNKCNQKCRICGPNFSTHWFKDAESPVDLSWSHVNHNHASQKLYTGAALIPVILKSMQSATAPFIVELKGGEPLYNDETFDLLSSMVSLGLDQRCASLKIITNGTAYSAEMLDLLAQFPSLDLEISIDATGKLHEYTRGTSMSWDQCRQKWAVLISTLQLQQVLILNTIYAYNAFEQGNLRRWAKAEFGTAVRLCDVLLHGPRYLSLNILPEDMLLQAADTMPDNMELKQKISQGLPLLDHDELQVCRSQFAVFTKRLDQLRGEYLLDLVPELAPMLAE